MLNQALVAGLNHLLAQNSWARERLQAHTGRVARLALSPVVLGLGIDAQGYFVLASSSVFDAEISVPPGTVPLLAQGLDRVMKQVSVSGNAEFADTLGFTLRHLRWDYEEDLARFTGDILARRLAQTLQHMAVWQASAARGLAESTSEYLTEEQPLLVRTADVEAFANEVDALRDDLARLEKRADRLEPRRVSS